MLIRILFLLLLAVQSNAQSSKEAIIYFDLRQDTSNVTFNTAYSVFLNDVEASNESTLPTNQHYVASGWYNIRIEALAYHTYELQNVRVSADKITFVRIPLTPRCMDEQDRPTVQEYVEQTATGCGSGERRSAPKAIPKTSPTLRDHRR